MENCKFCDGSFIKSVRYSGYWCGKCGIFFREYDKEYEFAMLICNQPIYYIIIFDNDSNIWLHYSNEREIIFTKDTSNMSEKEKYDLLIEIKKNLCFS